MSARRQRRLVRRSRASQGCHEVRGEGSCAIQLVEDPLAVAPLLLFFSDHLLSRQVGVLLEQSGYGAVGVAAGHDLVDTTADVGGRVFGDSRGAARLYRVPIQGKTSTPEERAAVVELLAEGWTVGEVAETTGWHVAQVRMWRKRARAT
jgi:Homeodomain-like domain-containing protein